MCKEQNGANIDTAAVCLTRGDEYDRYARISDYSRGADIHTAGDVANVRFPLNCERVI